MFLKLMGNRYILTNRSVQIWSSVGAKRAGLHPGFASHGALFLGQEQEHLCGGFDHYDSLSGDLAEFQVKVISALL